MTLEYKSLGGGADKKIVLDGKPKTEIKTMEKD
jgi:hypothetical protein